MSKLRKKPSPETAAALGFISAIGAVGSFYSAGVWHVAQYDRLSGRRDESVFNLLHRLCAADLAGLWSAEVQPKIRDRCLMYNRVASDKASDPNSFLEQESCHE